MKVVYKGRHPAVVIAATGQRAERGKPVDVRDDVAASLLEQGWQPAQSPKQAAAAADKE